MSEDVINTFIFSADQSVNGVAGIDGDVKSEFLKPGNKLGDGCRLIERFTAEDCHPVVFWTIRNDFADD